MECKEVKSFDNLPRSQDWQYEIKLDGYRCIAIKQNNEVELFSRRGLHFDQFPNIYQPLHDQLPKSYILDGEIVALDENGRLDFNALQNTRSKKRNVHYYAFDLLNLAGQNLQDLPLSQRQAHLESNFTSNEFFRVQGPLNAEVEIILKKIIEFGFEGIVAKQKSSLYLPGKRPGTWIKMKLKQSAEFIVGGYIPGTHGLDQLVVGRYAGSKFMYVESLDDGFIPATRRKVHAAISKLATSTSPFANLPEKRGAHRMDREKMKTVTWVKPKVVVEIAMNEWTPDRHLRHAEFKCLREDVTIRQVPPYPESYD